MVVKYISAQKFVMNFRLSAYRMFPSVMTVAGVICFQFIFHVYLLWSCTKPCPAIGLFPILLTWSVFHVEYFDSCFLCFCVVDDLWIIIPVHLLLDLCYRQRWYLIDKSRTAFTHVHPASYNCMLQFRLSKQLVFIITSSIIDTGVK